MDHPILTVLGRRGRAEVIEALRRAPGRTWTVRGLAEAAAVPPGVASRAVSELASLGAVERLRPGRAMRVTWRPASVVGAFLDRLELPDLAARTAEAFAAGWTGSVGAPRGVQIIAFRRPGDDPAMPETPIRIALVARDAEAALDAAGPGLDAVAAAGLPTPELVPVPRPVTEPMAEWLRRGTLVRFVGA